MTENLKKYRDVFNSYKKLNGKQAEYDNGYTQDRKTKNTNSQEIYKSRMAKMEKVIKDVGATSHILLQNDLAGCFFQNEKEMFFGFYYAGAIQFLCPYENFNVSNITNSGVTMGYNSQIIPSIGFDLGGLNSVGFGSIPVPKLNKPTSYSLSISYFDTDGAVKEYKLILDCWRAYAINQFKKVKEAVFFNDLVSDFTDARLKDIYNKLIAIPAVAEKIKNNEIIVNGINIQQIKQQYLSNKEEEKIFKDKIIQLAEVDETENTKFKWTIFYVIIVVILFVSLVMLIT